MRLFLRAKLKQVLRFLTVKVLAKHKPTIIAVIGEGETSIARELIFTVINSTYPAIRNIETPEAEFSVPLTIFGYKKYPKNMGEWVWVIIKTLLQLKLLSGYSHYIVLELDTVDPLTQKYWMDVLKPHMSVVTASTANATEQKIVLPTKQIKVAHRDNLLDNYKELAIRVGAHYQIDEYVAEAVLSQVELPSPRIRMMRGPNDSLIVDATHYYFPVSIKAVYELLDQTSRIIVFTDNQHDIKFLQDTKCIFNPHPYSPAAEDTIVFRGLRTRVHRQFRELLPKQTQPANNE